MFQIPSSRISAAEEVLGIWDLVHVVDVPEERRIPARGVQGDHLLPQEGHQQPRPDCHIGVIETMSAGNIDHCPSLM